MVICAAACSSRRLVIVGNWSAWLTSPTNRSRVLASNGSLISASVIVCHQLHIVMASASRVMSHGAGGADVDADADADMVALGGVFWTRNVV